MYKRKWDLGICPAKVDQPQNLTSGLQVSTRFLYQIWKWRKLIDVRTVLLCMEKKQNNILFLQVFIISWPQNNPWKRWSPRKPWNLGFYANSSEKWRFVALWSQAWFACATRLLVARNSRYNSQRFPLDDVAMCTVNLSSLYVSKICFLFQVFWSVNI